MEELNHYLRNVLGWPDLAVVAAVASRGFHDDPVMAWVFPDESLRADQLKVSFATLARRFVSREGRLDLLDGVCVSMWLPPDPPPATEEDPPPPDSWHLFSAEIAERFTTLGAVMEAAHPAEPHWYLGVVATIPEEQGRGLGARILRPVLEVCDRHGLPAYLESSNARNLPFYYRQGFVQIGELMVPEGPTLFPMWREPRGR